jgi:glycosyltransferase involved in cell wall biosynthesis
MRILHIIRSVNPKGGGPIEGVTQLSNYYEEHCNCGLDCHTEVLSMDLPDDDFVKAALIKVHALGQLNIGGYGYTAKLKPWLLEHAHEYDAIIINGIWQYHSFGAWRALKKLGIPYYVFTHGMLDPWFKKAYPLKHLKKWLYWPWADYRVLRDAEAVLFTCEEERRLAPQSFWLYKANGIVVNYGTKQSPAEKEHLLNLFMAKHPKLAGKRIFLFLSRIHEKKGCDLLIEAFSKVCMEDPLLHLVMAGPGSEVLLTKLKALASQLGIAERITWLGMVQGDEKWAAYYASEAFVLPSHQENFGIVVAEALACGLPVLISDKVNIFREIEADGAGVVNTDTVDGTVKTLRKWLSFDAEERQKIAKQAKLTFVNRFTIEAMAKSISHVVLKQSL